MKSLAPLIALALLTSPGSAQVLPEPSFENPRIQSVRFEPGQEIQLTALPETGLTLVLEPGEQITRVAVDDGNALQATVSAESDGLLLMPKRSGQLGGIAVDTNRRSYRFALRTGRDLMAAYLVQIEHGPPPIPMDVIAPSEPMSSQVWRYRLRGDRKVRPLAISDDGKRTFIEFAPRQALPAIFAIGPSGKEQVVNGHMRGGVFVIDRVWQRLVFRIDKEKASARRNEAAETKDG